MTYNMKYNDRKIDTLTPLMIVDICVLFEKKINFENNKNKKNKFKMRLL